MIKCTFKYKSFNFPCGEKHIIIQDVDNLPIPNITFEYENDSEIMELLLIAGAIKRLGGHINKLEIPYVPYSRQDRINIDGEAFSLKIFCTLINMINASEVIITDPHSDVTPALLNNCTIIYQHDIFEKLFSNKSNFFLVSPDGGSLKKIYKLASIVKPIQVIECSKQRNTSSGDIVGVNVPCGRGITNEFIIVDDICDGGRTFIEIAKEIKSRNNSKVTLMATHGFFTKGLDVFNDLIDEIYTRKGRIK